MTKECTSIVGHFDGQGGVPGQYIWHCPMCHVQGYLRSHWMPPLGDYLLRIAPVATRATSKQTTINKYTYFAGCFDGHGNAPVHNRHIVRWRRSRASRRCAGAIQMASPDAACPRLPQKPLDAAIGQLLTLYCPSSLHGNRQTNNNQQIHLLCWPF